MSEKKPRDWSPRLWEGLDYFAWLRLLSQNRFAVEPPYWYIAGIMSCVTLSNTFFRWVQHGLYNNRINDVKLQHPPLFVLGHWRTGTTLLHELLILDDRFSTPTTHDCFMPCHSLVSERFFKEYLGFLMPNKRPMDNMAAGWDRPQEDEFALCLLGEPSTYTDIAFPNRPPLSPGALDLSGLTPREKAHWKRTLERFVKTLAVRDPRRLVLKSPPHTARIPELLELFPDAKFVHIRRDPYTLFASTMNLWMSLAKSHGLQTPRGGEQLEEKVYREFRTITERYLATKDMIPAGHLVEVRYEEFVKDLVGGMQHVYDGLQLDDFETVQPKIEAYAARTRTYETNKYTMTDSQRAAITTRWGDLIAKLGYG